jgi:hypothetical protein
MGKHVAVHLKFEPAIADKLPKNAAEVFLDSANRLRLKRRREARQEHLGKMRIGRGRQLGNIQFFALVGENRTHVKRDRPFDNFVKSLGVHGPLICKPKCRAFHSHPKLREAAAIKRHLCGPEGPREVRQRNTAGVVADNDPAAVMARGFDRNFQFEVAAMKRA